MDYHHTLESQSADEEVNDSLVEQPLEAGNTDARWQARIAEYESVGLEKSNLRTAVLVPLIAGLIGRAGHMQDIIDRTLADKTATMEDINRLEPSLNLHLRIMRQIDRFVTFEAREDAVEAEKANARRRQSAITPNQPHKRPTLPR